MPVDGCSITPTVNLLLFCMQDVTTPDIRISAARQIFLVFFIVQFPVAKIIYPQTGMILTL